MRHPRTYLRTALTAALRRRYAYAAVRILRRGLARALAEHERRTYGADRYNGADEWEQIYRGYLAALKRLERRFSRDRIVGALWDPRSLP